jgi:hypothetical protein
MPVRTGRVSLREAERATFTTIATKASPGRRTRFPSGTQGADVEGRGAADDLDVLLGRAQLERDVGTGQRADDVDDEAGRHQL